MTPTGSEQSPVPKRNGAFSRAGDAESGARGAPKDSGAGAADQRRDRAVLAGAGGVDTDLAAVVEAWHTLAPATRAVVVELVRLTSSHRQTPKGL